MSKKTIGLNPLEAYLSAPKTSRKSAEKKAEPEKAAKPIKKAKPAAKKAEVTSVAKSVEEAPVKAAVLAQHALASPELAEAVEVDVQGQLAIKGTRVPKEKIERPSKQRITLHISADLVDRVKNAVYWEPGLTVAGFAEEAFTRTIEELEQERGAPFPQRKQHRLRGGRPVS